MIDRFEQLSEPAATRGQMLEDSLVLFQFINDTQEEMDWIREKKPLVSSEDYGHNLNGLFRFVAYTLIYILKMASLTYTCYVRPNDLSNTFEHLDNSR